jgi:hypothetical protein
MYKGYFKAVSYKTQCSEKRSRAGIANFLGENITERITIYG